MSNKTIFLYPLSKKIAIDFVDGFENLSDEDLKKIILECGEMTAGNCWWVAYDLRHAIRDIAETELQRRKGDSEASHA